MEHPVRVLLRNGLPEFGFGVMRHGFAEAGRDYVLILEDTTGRHPEVYELTLTHVEGLTCTARVEAAPNDPAASVKWSVALPGVSVPATIPDAQASPQSPGRPLHEVAIETDHFFLSMIFCDARLRLLSAQSHLTQAI